MKRPSDGALWVSSQASITVRTNPNYTTPLSIREMRQLFDRAIAEGATEDSAVKAHVASPSDHLTSAWVVIRAKGAQAEGVTDG